MNKTDTAVLESLATLLAPAIAKQMQDPRFKVTASGTPSEPYVHGPAGLFGVSGLERDVISTRLTGEGLASILPARGTIHTNPLFPYITGYQDISGTVPTGACDDPQTAGQMKSCIQTAPLGRFALQTREAEINRVGQLVDRGEFDDLTLLNDPLAGEFGKSIFPRINPNAQLSAGAELLARMLELGIGFANWIGRQTYTGNPTNNTAGGYAEFMGLDTLIGTTKVDAITGEDCESLHSDVKDMAYTCIGDENADPDIVQVMVTMYRFVRHIARKNQLMPVNWVWTMREGLFWELTDYWPCRYHTYLCRVIDSGFIDPVPGLDSAAMTAMRDAMRQGRYLMIDGEQIPVIIDDYIEEESSDDTNLLAVGNFASDMYLVPLTVTPRNIPVTYWHYLDYAKGAMQAVVQGRATNWFWTDGGMYLWTLDTQNFCIVHEAKIEPRILLRTPHIAGRITNVCYNLLQHPRDVHPDDAYWVDGGVTTRDPPSLYEDWSS